MQLTPEGHFDLILQSDLDILHKTDTSQGWELRPRLFVGGLHSRHYQVQALKAGTRLISVQFKPGAAKFFIPDRLDLFKNRVVNLEQVYAGQKIATLLEVDPNAPFLPLLDRLETFLLEVFYDRGRSPIDQALRQLNQQHGFARIEQLARQVCLSKPQFRKRFREEIGMSPKEYSKIVRVNTLKRYLEQKNESVHFTRLSYQLGYFDQAHLIKEFQSVMGTTPRRYWASLQAVE